MSALIAALVLATALPAAKNPNPCKPGVLAANCISGNDINGILDAVAGTVNVTNYLPAGYVAGTTDATSAVQAALDAAGHWTYENPYRNLMTAAGKATVYAPCGTYKITAGLKIGGGVTLRGAGPCTVFDFVPSSTSDFLSPDVAKATTGATFTDIHLSDFQVFGTIANANARDGLRMLDCSLCTIARVTVARFKRYGVFFGTDGAGGPYYNKTEKLNLYDNVVNLQVGPSASAFVDVGSTLWHTADFTGADYTAIVTGGNNATFVGTKFQGRPNIAQVSDAAAGTTFLSNYAETQVASGIPDKPFVRWSGPTRGDAAASVVNPLKQKYLLGQWAATATEESYYQPQLPVALSVGTPYFLPDLIQNPGKYGMWGWTLGAGSNGVYQWDTTKTFSNGRGSIQLTTAAGSAENFYAAIYTIPAAKLSKHVGRRIYVTILLRASTGATVDTFLQGAGNSHEKYTYNNQLDFGNGWVAKELDLPVLSAADMTLTVRVTGDAATVNFTDVFAYLDGYDWIPHDRETRIEGTAAPASPTLAWVWARGDSVQNSAPSPGAPLEWVCTAAGWQAVAWAPSTAYGTVGAYRQANGNVYRLVTAGTSAGSGGPSGTGTGIVDGTAVWDFVSAVAVFTAGPSLAP